MANRRKIVAVAVFALLICQVAWVGLGDFGAGVFAQYVWHNSGVWIREDGAVEPESAPLRRVGNVYSFTEDIWMGIAVNKSDVVIDGNGHVLKSNYYVGTGLLLQGVNNVTVQNLRVEYFSVGVYLDHSNGSVVKESSFKACGIDVKQYSQGNQIVGNDVEKSIAVDRSDDNVVSGNDASSVSVSYSTNVSVIGNRVIDAKRSVVYSEGINFDNSADCDVFDNFVQNKTVGVNIWVCSNLTLTNNRLLDNQYGFKLWGSDLQTNLQRIDPSNTVSGKPVYFLVNRTDYKVPSNAGWVAAVNCRNITVEDWVSTPNWDGVLFVYTQDSKIVDSKLVGNFNGVRFDMVSNITLAQNLLSGNEYSGFYFEKAVDCLVTQNEVKDNFCFFNVWSGSERNRLFGNDFVGNFTGYLEAGYQNLWVNGGKGNFWSLFAGVDLDRDGVSDLPFVIYGNSNQTDKYPLMDPFFGDTRLYVQSQITRSVVLAVPEQYVNYTVSNVDGRLWAKVEAVWFVHVISRTEAPLKLVYATAPDSANFVVKLDGAEVAWSNASKGDLEVFHNTSIGIWQMIQYSIDPEANDFLLKFSYEHPVQMINGSYRFIYDLNVEPFLWSLSERVVTHFRVSFDANQSAVDVYALGNDGEWDLAPFYSSRNLPMEPTDFIVTSEYDQPLAVALAMKLVDIQIPEFSTLMVVSLLVVSSLVALVVFRRRREGKI